MFEFIKNFFIGLISTFITRHFGESLASKLEWRIKCVSSVLISVVKVAVLLMIHLLEYVFQIK